MEFRTRPQTVNRTMVGSKRKTFGERLFGPALPPRSRLMDGSASGSPSRRPTVWASEPVSLIGKSAGQRSPRNRGLPHPHFRRKRFLSLKAETGSCGCFRHDAASTVPVSKRRCRMPGPCRFRRRAQQWGAGPNGFLPAANASGISSWWQPAETGDRSAPVGFRWRTLESACRLGAGRACAFGSVGATLVCPLGGPAAAMRGSSILDRRSVREQADD